MKNLGRAALALWAALAMPRAAWAANTESSSGATFLKMGQGSTRAMSIGRAYVALAEGADSLNWNPAGLGVTQQKEAVYAYLRPVGEISSPLYLGYAHPMGRTVWGANIAYMSLSGLDIRDATGRPNNDSSAQIRDGFGGLAIARSFWYEKLFLGGGLRLIHEDNAGSLHDTVTADLGALLKPNNLISLGLAVQNLGSGKGNVPSTVRGGAALRLGDFVVTSLELSKDSDDQARVGLGAEFGLPEEYLEFGALTFRVGYFTADNLGASLDPRLKAFSLDRSNGFSFGFGIYTSRAFGYGVAIDYAIVPSGSLGTVDQISLKLKF